MAVMRTFSYISNIIIMDASHSPTTKPLYRGTQIIWYLLGVVEVLLAFRFVLKFLDANAAAPFTDLVYSASSFLAAPFLSVFRVSQVAGSVFEWTTLLAMAVYWLIAVGLVQLLVMGKTVSTPEAGAKLNAQQN